ncbi:uncharacterized protein LOC115783995 [Archocentrus centrarchus]|uniref:uncharacterized protein LOC115783995 n=1 Tax=Archocentrus centrarchus TaxID=63155 RepID=UPI0011EA1999|nr:uncharacterized protein LOC115783995 [Archocentrus centrarchus]XP_030590894.1 uncharacterized protein LOC115783995 [Archocentrus centrarchus]
MTFDQSEEPSWPAPPSTPCAGVPEAVMTPWGDIRDPVVQEFFIYMSFETFRAEIQKLPAAWAHKLWRKRKFLKSPGNYGHKKAAPSELHREREQNVERLIRHNFMWQMGYLKARYEMEEIKMQNAQSCKSNAALERELTRLKGQARELEKRWDFLNKMLAVARAIIKEQASVNQRLTAERDKLKAINDQLKTNLKKEEKGEIATGAHM